MNGYFITGTDTDAGKTSITAALLRALLNKGESALAIKPVQTGCTQTKSGLQAPDAAVYAEFAAPYFPHGYPDVCCRKFIPACSPHLAAEWNDETLDVDQLTREVQAMAQGRSTVLVEGAGGVAVPLAAGCTTLDLMQRLDLPVIIVVGNKLGAVNHALLSIEAVRNRGLRVAGVIMTHTTAPAKADMPLLRDNTKTIAREGHVPVLADIPFLDGPDYGKSLVQYADKALALLQQQKDDCPEDILFDRKHIWHPYTSATNPLPTVKVRSAHGVRLVLEDGRELLDGMASWWCAIHGYAHPNLDAAAHAQLGRMSHVMFGGLTHDPAIRLCRTLREMSPNGLEHVFLADSGSVSVEAAIKMALQYMQASGQTARTKLFTVQGGYHGDTCGAMSVCDPTNGMHHLFSGLLPKQIFAPRPACAFHQPFDTRSLDQTARILEANSHEIAAIIVEPIVQGAGGMWFYHPQYLQGLRHLADKHGILLILDEIATGFGRTGKLFACEWSGIVPDIMCVGKALTGGYMTLAATLASENVAHTISRDGGVFMHGPTFMGNPLACAVANASLDLLRTTDWETNVHNIESWLDQSLAPCRDLPDVTDVRVLGAIGVVEMKDEVNMANLQEFFVEKEVWLRPFGKLIYIMPPYIMSREEIFQLAGAVHEAIRTNQHR